MSNLAKRRRSEKRFKAIGYFAILVSFSFLIFLLYTIVGKGINGFQQTKIQLELNISEELVESGSYSKIISNSLYKKFPEVESRSDKKALRSIVAGASKFILQDRITSDPSLIGQTVDMWLPAEEKVDIYYKRNVDDWDNKISKDQKNFVANFKDKGRLSLQFNHLFFAYGDSQEPELAGIAGALVGSLLTIIVCMLSAIPIAVLAAVYLEEFAPKNKLTEFIEVNINNLAAVPSIIFGLLGLAVYLNFFGMPRSAPLVGGFTMALMVVPVIIIATRASLKAVPPSIRQAAMGIGASPLQVVLHHTLPLAMPGIMTGTILGVARALGETAPLLMIGMVAFIADIPSKFTDPATVMPVQIFLWSKNNQPGFVDKTAAAIIVLLAILILLNIIAVWVRKKYERRW